MKNKTLPKLFNKSDDIIIVFKEADEANLTMKKRLVDFKIGFEKRLLVECSQSEIERFSEPDNYMALIEASRYIARFNSTEKRLILRVF